MILQYTFSDTFHIEQKHYSGTRTARDAQIHSKKRQAKSHAMTYSNITGALIMLCSLMKNDGHTTSAFTTPKATNCNNLY